MAPPCFLSADAEGSQDTASSLHEDSLVASNALMKHNGNESCCTELLLDVSNPVSDGSLKPDEFEQCWEDACKRSSSEPELEPDGFDLDSDAFHSGLTAQSQKEDWASVDKEECSEEDWEPIRASNMQRQETDENWPAWNPSINSGPPGTFFAPSSCQVSESSNEESEPQLCATTWMAHDATDFMATQTVPSLVPIVYPWPVVQPKQFNSAGRRPLRPKRHKRETVLDIAKRKEQIRFCAWCGESFQPSFKFCAFCGVACDVV